jgi:putative glutamine amidotransferase
MRGGKILVAAGRDEKAAPYVEALQAVGVAGERITVLTPGAGRPGLFAELVSTAAGLVLSGGVDIAPERYGEAPLANANLELYPERDEMEWELLAAAQARRTPVWCVCRGLQVANAFLGGTLWQDLPTQLPSPVLHAVADTPDTLAHPVRASGPETALKDRLSRESLLVNSRHHQAIKDLAPGLLPAALSPDGLIEAIELAGEGAGGWWLKGVQWHPENLIAMALERALWADFVAAVGSADPEGP